MRIPSPGSPAPAKSRVATAPAKPAPPTTTPGPPLVAFPSVATRVGNGLVGLVALEHVGFLVAEMFLWTTAFGLKFFGTTAAFAAQSASLAANQGLYNGFLAAGLAWSLVPSKGHADRARKLFFLGCVAVAGVFGGLTTRRGILVVQALPALLAMGLVWWGGRRDDRAARAS